MKDKLFSRKFWICAAAFLCSIVIGIAGACVGNDVVAGMGIGSGVFSAAVYSACETAVDRARIFSDITETRVHLGAEAKSDDVMTVAAVLAPMDVLEEQHE